MGDTVSWSTWVTGNNLSKDMGDTTSSPISSLAQLLEHRVV